MDDKMQQDNKISDKEIEQSRDQDDISGTEDMVRKVRKAADDIRVPPSLEPGAVERLLEAKGKKKRRKYIRIYAGTAAAACLCAVIGLGAAHLTGNPRNETADDTAGPPAGSAEAGDSDISSNPEEGLETAEDYNDIYRYIQAQRETEENQTWVYNDGKDAGIVEESTSSAADAANTGTSGSYSDTNVRTEGVGEADIVKTDGENIYLVNGNLVEIVDIASDEMEHLARIEMDEDCYPTELYAADGRLLVLYTREEYDDGKTGYDGIYRQYTCTDIYDISDPADPEKISTVSQSGYYSTMRVRDGYAYVLSNFSLPYEISRPEPRTYVPEVQGEVMAASDIYMPQREMGDEYTVITAFSLENPEEKTDSKAVFGTAGECYVSTENIYVTESYYNYNDAGVTQTSIRRVSYKDGTLTGTARTKVDGILNDSFSIDEYDGYLRLVTTVTSTDQKNGGFLDNLTDMIDGEATENVVESEDSNSLYILDGDLNVTGQIRDLAPDEQVYSARLMGDIGYFVTFRQVDPLFSADLSDPYNPRIIGELKIPGFSEYLHPYGEGLLLGIGMEVDEESVATEGVKLSMFDISDPADVKEEARYILEDTYGSDAGYDYKAVFVDAEKNLFGFLSYGDPGRYTVFAYDEKNGFTELFSRTINWGGNVRGMYAGERFYLISANTIESYRLSDFEKVDDIVL